ncbi:hypothetical protein ACS5PN_30870 [Roseateles sp. NT4]|uniref:hypothetical protein n=1 Tax=Roseateles sp. NT4 TaxID=3453715 RepID=UPI003EEAA8D0
MKILIATLACLVSLPALADDADMQKARYELRTACAQSYASFIAHQPAGNPAEYRGDKQPGDNAYYGDAKPCSEEQLAAYLDKADPALVMRAYPSAAGRPKAKEPTTAPSAPVKG